MHAAQDVDQLWALVNAVMNNPVTQIEGNFWTS